MTKMIQALTEVTSQDNARNILRAYPELLSEAGMNLLTEAATNGDQDHVLALARAQVNIAETLLSDRQSPHGRLPELGQLQTL